MHAIINRKTGLVISQGQELATKLLFEGLLLGNKVDARGLDIIEVWKTESVTIEYNDGILNGIEVTERETDYKFLSIVFGSIEGIEQPTELELVGFYLDKAKVDHVVEEEKRILEEVL